MCASSSYSISISFIGFLIHLISISILLYNYVIINSKSDATQKKYRSFYPQPLNSKTTFPSELVILPIILNQALICTPTPNLMAVKGGTQHSIVALSTLVTHIIIVVLEVLQLEGSVMMFIEDQVQLILLISTHYNNCFIYR